MSPARAAIISCWTCSSSNSVLHPKTRNTLEFTLQRACHDARYQGIVTVWYPFHPFFREHDFCVMRKFGCRNVEYLDLQGPLGRQAVPSWAVDADLCAQMTCGLQPATDLPALLELVRWLKQHPATDL